MRITTDPVACVGSGQCALALPDVFDQDDDLGTVVVVDERPPGALHDDVRDAAGRCPVRAITLTDA